MVASPSMTTQDEPYRRAGFNVRLAVEEPRLLHAPPVIGRHRVWRQWMDHVGGVTCMVPLVDVLVPMDRLRAVLEAMGQQGQTRITLCRLCCQHQTYQRTSAQDRCHHFFPIILAPSPCTLMATTPSQHSASR
jgi:hypothetical protein